MVVLFVMGNALEFYKDVSRIENTEIKKLPFVSLDTEGSFDLFYTVSSEQ